MTNWKRKTEGLILRNIIYLLYGEPSAQNGEKCIFQNPSKKKEYISIMERRKFLEEHFAGYIQLSTVDNYAITDLIGGKIGKAAKGASGSVRKDFIDLICREQRDENGKTPLEVLVSKNRTILARQIYDKEDFYHKVSHFMKAAKDSDETKISTGNLLELYDYIYYYLNWKNEEGYAVALSWLLIAALLQNRMNKLMDYCKHPVNMKMNTAIIDASENPILNVNEKKFAPRTNLYSLDGRYPQVREIFDGREDCLKQINCFFAEGKRVLFLKGIGGIGKSEIAKQYALKYRKEYDTIVFAPYSSNLIDLVCDADIIRIRHLQQQKNETREEFFWRKLKILQDITDERTLIILDNFDVDSDEKLNEFLKGNYRVLITTRNEHPGYHCLNVDIISEEAALFRIFEKNYGASIQDLEERVYVRKIIQHVWYHTYMIELIAKQMQASFLSAREMYELLEKDSIQNMPQETVEGGFERKCAFEHICHLFNTSRLNEEKKQILRCMSLMGISGVVAKRFREWSGLENFESINQLIRQSWIRREADRKISLHPLIVSVIWTMDTPTVQNCSDFLEQIQRFCMYAWWRNVQENMAVAENILAVLKYFQKKDGELPFGLWCCSHFLWQVGRFEESILYGHLFYESSVRQYGENSMEAGLMANKLGGCYYNTGKLEESISWYQKGLQCMLASGAEENEDIALAYEKVGRCYTWSYEQNFDKAKEYLYHALEIRQKILEKFEQGTKVEKCFETQYSRYDIAAAQRCIAENYLEIGRMYQSMGEFGEALNYAKLSIEKNKLWGIENISGIAYNYYDMGVCYYHFALEERRNGREAEAIAQWKQAKNYFQTALKLNLGRRGDLAIDCINNEEYLADTYAALGEDKKAEETYQSTLEMVEKLLGKDSERYRLIQEKMNSMDFIISNSSI